MSGTEFYNVTMLALEQASIMYSMAQKQLEKININMPNAEQLPSLLTTWVAYIMSCAPTVVQQFYVLLDQVQFNDMPFVPILIALVLLYFVYCTLMASFRWVYRLITGFIRFSLIVAILGCGFYLAQQKWMDGAAFPGSSTTTGDKSKTYNAL
ncbi:hypothetical protein K501DRAFT_282756 [Backusella circina FSU 941]|nr:hypothetical protein K501DRAFT_282756 [Backusella circina FSU 941]